MDLIKQFNLVGYLLLVTVGVGFWLSRLGKPYHNLLFNIHKFIALAGVVLVVMRLINLDPFISFPLPAVVLIGAALTAALAMFVSGAMLSIQDDVSRLFQGIHQISAGIIALSTLAALYVLQ